MAKIRIMLADDHTLFRQGIRTLISAEADMEVVGEAANGGDAVDWGTVALPDAWPDRLRLLRPTDLVVFLRRFLGRRRRVEVPELAGQPLLCTGSDFAKTDLGLA